MQGASHMPSQAGNIDEQLLQSDLDKGAAPLQRYASLTGRGGGWFSQIQARGPQLLLAQLHKSTWLQASAVATAWMLRPTSHKVPVLCAASGWRLCRLLCCCLLGL